MPQLSTCLWFDGNAEEAAEHYVSLFPNSSISSVSRYDERGPFPAGTAIVVEFELDGVRYQTLNGGPQYSHSPAFSTSVLCDTQEEIDHYWNGLLAGGGQESQCGWLTDRFGVSWQIVPRCLGALLGDEDPARSQRALEAMLGMTKLDIETLQKAADGEGR